MIKKNILVRQLKRSTICYANLGKNIGHEINKMRPVIVLRNNAFIKSSNTLIVPLSSRKESKKILKTDIIIYPTTHNRLKNISIAKIDQLRTISIKRVKNASGRIDQKTMSKIEVKLKLYLGIK